MTHKIIRLNTIYNLKYDPLLEVYMGDFFDKEMPMSPGLLIIPGGGYWMVSNREKDPVVFKFLLKGYVCFSLTYTTRDKGISEPLFFEPLRELLCAMDYINNHADEFNVNKDRIFMMGFSAGAHLASSYPYMMNEKEVRSNLKLSSPMNEVRPFGMCLAYPVISLCQNTHEGSAFNLVGKDIELRKRLSTELHIDETYPPTFLWHTKDDDCVPYINSLNLAKELKKCNVKYKLVLFNHGNHGLSIADAPLYQERNEEVAGWVDHCDAFFKSLN